VAEEILYLKNYNLNIAGYNIRIESASSELDLLPSERFKRNIVPYNFPDINIKVHKASLPLPDDAEQVFHAPLVEEINGAQVKKSDDFWSVYKYRSELFIKTIFPYSDPDKSSVLRFSLTSRDWDLYLKFNGNSTDPLDYPIDSLILYYLTVMNGDIMVHASAASYAGHGYLFSGVSGKGKTTMAQLWEKAGANIIHDDRVIIRKLAGEFRMYNTPVYRDDVPSGCQITKIFLIEHGSNNRLIPIRGATAVSLFLGNCIQHNWNHEMVARLMGSVSIMCSVIPIFRLEFRPDRTIVDFILGYE